MLCPQAFWKHLNICNITSPEIAINWHTSVPYDKQFTLCNSHYQKKNKKIKPYSKESIYTLMNSRSTINFIFAEAMI